MINLKEVEFPYYSLVKNDEAILKIFENLKKYVPVHKKSLSNSTFRNYFLNFDKENDLMRITDYFSEDIRIRCSFNGNVSVFDWYQKNKKKIIDKFGEKANYEDVDYYIWKNTKACSNFPTVIAMEVLRRFKPKRWLDPSSGWGDRLISAIAYGCEYHGYDPNKKMQRNYKDIINFFDPDNKENYRIMPTPFEKAKIRNDNYDLVFTSPPFFDLEDYDVEETQSHRAYPKIDDWKENFLIPLIIKSDKALVRRGHLALYVSDFNTYKNYVDDVKDYVTEYTNLEYKGYISWTLSRKMKRCIFVWKKK